MADEVKAPRAKRGEGAGAKPRPAYLAYKMNGDTLEVVLATRKAEELLALVDNNRDMKYVRFEIK